MKDYSNYYPSTQNRMLTDAELVFNIQLETHEGFDVLIDGVASRVLVYNHLSDLNVEKEERIVTTKKDSLIHRGSLVEYENESYLVITDVDSHSVYKKCKMQKCNHLLKWIDDGAIVSSPSIVQNKTLYTSGIHEYNQLKEGNMVESIILPFNDKTKKIDRDKRFIINNHVWTTTKTDWDVKGIISIMCEEDKINTNDNLDLGIADYYNNVKTYSMEVLNGDKISLLSTSNPYQLNVKVSCNGAEIANPSLTYSSTNTNTVQVNETGLITVSGYGASTISISGYGLNKTIYVVVEAVPQNNFTYILNANVVPENEIIQGVTKLYTIKKLNNGIEVPCQFNFNIVYGVVPTNSIEFKILNDNQCSIKNLKYNSTPITLRCVDSSDNKVAKELNIRLKGLV